MYLARKDIGIPLDRQNRNNHNDNYTQLFEGVQQVKKTLDDLVLESGGGSNLEVIQARGGESTLNSRLDKLDDKDNELSSQLADTEQELERLNDTKVEKSVGATKQELTTKITKGKVTRQDLDSSSDSNKWNINDLDEKTRQAILEANDIEIDYVLGEESVTRENLADGSGSFEKRTRLGDLAHLIIGSSGNAPNIDVSDRTLTFNSDVFVISGKERYTIEGGTVVDLVSGVFGIVVYYDVDNHRLVSKSATKLDTNLQSYILIATVYFKSGGVLQGVNMNCRYTIDGINPEMYYLDKVPLKALSHAGSFPFVTLGSGSDKLPDFDPDNKTLYFFNSFFIFMGKERYTVDSTVIDFDVPSATGVAIYFNTNTGKFITVDQRDTEEVPETSLLFALVYRMSSDIGWKLLINTEYTINGKPRYSSGGEVATDHPYVFASQPLVGNYPNSDLVGIGEEGSPFDIDNDTHETINGFFDDLMNENEGYISRELLGYDTSTGVKPIYSYSFYPKRPIYKTPQNYKPYPEITITGNIHGREIISVYTLCYFFKRICEDWRDDDVLEYLRHNVKFTVIPVLAPWEFDNQSYGNIDGVNVNRNFDYMWDDADPEVRGEYPFSTNEAQIVRDMLQERDPLFHLDCHTRGGNQQVPDNRMMWIANSVVDTHYIALNTIEEMTRKWKKEYGVEGDFFGYSSIGNAGGVSKGYVTKVMGIPAVTWETFYRSDSFPESAGKDVMNMSVDYFGQYVVNLIKFYQYR